MEETLRRFVEILARSDGRVPGEPGHARAATYIADQLGKAGIQPYEGQEFDFPFQTIDARLTNVAGYLPGSKPYLPAIFLNAHYDTCGVQPGADDNAAAIAILLRLAPQIAAMDLEHTVVFLFPDAEEPPYFLTPAMGSTVFFEQQCRHDVHCAIVLDLVGHDVPLPGLEELLFVTGLESDPALAEALECVPKFDGLAPAPTLTRYVGDLSDYHIHRIKRRPYLFLTCGRWEHYHAASDTPDRLNYAKMEAVAQYLLQLVALVDRSDFSGPFEGYDSTPVELKFLRKAFGTLVDSMGLPLNSREDIDRIAALVTQHFGL